MYFSRKHFDLDSEETDNSGVGKHRGTGNRGMHNKTYCLEIYYRCIDILYVATGFRFFLCITCVFIQGGTLIKNLLM